MTEKDQAVDVAFLELAGTVDPHHPSNLLTASLAVQRTVKLPYGSEKVAAYKAAITAADIADVWGSEPEDFHG